MDFSKDRTFLQSLQHRRDSLRPGEKRVLQAHALKGISAFLNKTEITKNHFPSDVIKRYAEEKLRINGNISISEIAFEINADFKSFRQWVELNYPQ